MEVTQTGMSAEGKLNSPPNWTLWLMRGLCLVALGIASFLAYQTLTSSEIAGCAGDGMWDCSHVLHSRWSKVAGIPVSIPAGLVYVAMFVGLVFASPRFSPRVRQWGWSGVTLAAVSAGAAALWFISLQAFVLQHFCQYCMVAHSCGLVLCGLIIWWKPLAHSWSSAFASAGVMGVLGLITTQLLSEPPKAYAIEVYDQPGEAGQLAVEMDVPFAAPEGEEVFGAPGVMESPIEEPSPTSTTLPEAVPSPTDSVAIAPLGPPQPAPSPLPADEPATQLSEDAAAPSTGEETSDTGDATETTANLGTAAEDNGADSQENEAAQEGDANDAAGDESSADEATDKQVEEKKTEEEKPVVKAERQETYLGGRIRLNTYHWPIVGDPGAKHVLVELFDYTSPHCRTMNQHLKVARERFGENVAILVLPVPLNRNCNDTVTMTKAQHFDACELGRLAVAMWRVAPDKFEQYHNWLFESISPRTAADARRYAEQLVDPKALRAELDKPIPGKFLTQHVELYKRAGSGAIPKLLFTNITIKGEMRSAEELCGLMERELKLSAPVATQ